MADKYIRHGETYNGDGTSSAAATSNGGVGAWNTITYLEGATPAYGSIAAGDVIYIRSKDAAGADITRTRGAANVNIGSTAATEALPITWILDSGSVWPGIDGTLEFTTSNTNYRAILRDYNKIVAERREGIVFKSTATSSIGDATTLVDSGLGCLLKNVKFDYSSHTNQTPRFCAVNCNAGTVVESAVMKAGALTTSNNAPSCPVFGANLRRGQITIIDPDIELTTTTIGGTGLLYLDGTYGADFVVIGGRVWGAGAITDQPVLSHSASTSGLGSVRAIGFDIPRSMTIVGRGGFANTPGSLNRVELIGCDGGIGGHLELPWGRATSRTDNNPPTLSATLPDTGSSNWAWRVYPYSATQRTPMQLITTKLYTGSAAAKTINQEILVANTMSPNKSNLWITVDYTDDATGLPKHISTQDFTAGALDTSTAAWTATVWGLVTLLKRKFEITTPTAIKPNTPITVTLQGTLKSVTANDIYFVDPDFGVN